MIPRSKARCGWCIEQPPTFFERHIIDHLPINVFFWLLKIMRVLDWPAREWHNRFHREEWELIMDQWIKNLQPGDKVCTCAMKHETVESVNPKAGELTTVEGNTHDIWHCISPVDHDEASHAKDLQDWLDSQPSV